MVMIFFLSNSGKGANVSICIQSIQHLSQLGRNDIYFKKQIKKQYEMQSLLPLCTMRVAYNDTFPASDGAN